MRTLIMTAALAASLLAASPGLAAVLTATSVNPDVADFTIRFDDTNTNGLFDLSELVHFSGFDANFFGPLSLVSVLASPNVAGIAVAGMTAGAIVYPDTGWWSFESQGNIDLSWDFAADYRNWTYTVNTAAVPLPAGLPLLLASLGGLALVGRRRGKVL